MSIDKHTLHSVCSTCCGLWFIIFNEFTYCILCIVSFTMQLTVHIVDYGLEQCIEKHVCVNTLIFPSHSPSSLYVHTVALYTTWMDTKPTCVCIEVYEWTLQLTRGPYDAVPITYKLAVLYSWHIFWKFHKFTIAPDSKPSWHMAANLSTVFFSSFSHR